MLVSWGGETKNNKKRIEALDITIKALEERATELNPVLTLEELKPGTPCCVEFKVDNSWTGHDPTICVDVGEKYVSFCNIKDREIHYCEDVVFCYSIQKSDYMTKCRCLKITEADYK